MNPFLETAGKPADYIRSLKDIYPHPYDKNTVDPYTKTRIILAAGAEYESNWFSHQTMRRIPDVDFRRDLSLVRYVEKQQQQRLSHLKPVDETVLETTISYEQLAVDLTAEMAQREKNFYVKKALDFALLEDFDHLYRYADLLDMDDGIHAERLVGRYTEIMPGRPTAAHHRHPFDNVKHDTDGKNSETMTVLNTMIITAAEQQTMNYYMNNAAAYKNDRGRKLYEEICLVEEEHVTQYESLIDTSCSAYECLLWHEYAECYVYWSNYMTETDKNIKKIWEYCLEAEISHLDAARKILQKYEHKDYNEVIRQAEFPAPLSLHSNIDYVRSILKNTVQYTGNFDDYEDINKMSGTERYFNFNNQLTEPVKDEAGHSVITDYIKDYGSDYRFETNSHPIKELSNRNEDNVAVGTTPNVVQSGDFQPIKHQ